MKHLVIVNGYPRVGKDTFIELCRTKLFEQGIMNKNVSMIDETIAMIRSHSAMSDFAINSKSPEDRKLMATVHKALLDFGNGPIEALFSRFGNTEGDAFVGFTCCREPETIERLMTHAIQSGWKVSTVMVHRTTNEPIVTDADRHVNDYTYDSYIFNTGTIEQLDELVDQFLQTRLKSVFDVPSAYNK